MAQVNSFALIGNQNGLNFRLQQNGINSALQSSGSGSTAPINPVAGMFWFDTSAQILKVRNNNNTAWVNVQTAKGLFDAVITSNTTLNANNTMRIYRIDATSNNVTVTLPASENGLDYLFTRVDSSSNTVTIQRTGSDTINGNNTITIPVQNQSVRVTGAGSNVWRAFWFVANNSINTASIENSAVTYAKIQNVAANRLLGRGSGSGVVQEISIGTGLSISGTTLNSNIEAFPVGAVFLSVVSTNPSTLLGYGTWTQIAQGRAIIGVGTGNDGSNTLTTTAAEQTGGFYRHTLTISEMPSHAHNVYIPGRGVSSPANNNTVGLGNNAFLGQVDINTGSMGSGNSHNNTQPYFSLYIWKRTA